MRHLSLVLPTVVLVALLAGCGSHGIFRDRGFDYLRAETVEPLRYPEGLRPIPAQELYPIPDVEQRRKLAAGEKPKLEIPPPPQLVSVTELAATPATPAETRVVSEAQVTLTRDGSGYPVLMLELAFDWAWQAVGDALKGLPGVEVADLDRERAAYFVVVDGKRNSVGEPWQLKLNYTSNGIQVALQVDDDAMAPKDISDGLMQKLREALLRKPKP